MVEDLQIWIEDMFLRRLIRRMTRHLNKLEIELAKLSELIELNIDVLKEMYPELENQKRGN